jgi:hypothetical protein
VTRGALHIVWKGDSDPTPALERSIASLKRWHPKLEHHVHWAEPGSTLLCKSAMYDLSPFDETLFLDADTVVMGNLDYGFEQANKHGMALCINANPFARRYRSMQHVGDVIEYNTGVIFWRKRDDVAKVFDGWKRLIGMDSSSSFVGALGVYRMHTNDQCAFSAAVSDLNFNPFVLPVNWNLQPKWQLALFGPVKVWHTYEAVPDGMAELNEEQSTPGVPMKCWRMP